MKIKLFAMTLALGLIYPVYSTVEDPFTETLGPITKVFGELRTSFYSIIVEPQARSQAIRSLRRLRNRFSDLLIEKEQYTYEVIKGSTAVQSQTVILRNKVEELRSSLNDFFLAMPASWQSRSGTLEHALSEALGGKWELLYNIEQSTSVTSDEDVPNAKQIELFLSNALAEIDKTITELSNDV